MSTKREAQFVNILSLIESVDQDYEKRYGLVLEAMHKAKAIGHEVGIRIDPDEPEWPVMYIELPTGQVSWHMPQHDKEWDGHTTEQKYERIGAYRREVYDNYEPEHPPVANPPRTQEMYG